MCTTRQLSWWWRFGFLSHTCSLWRRWRWRWCFAFDIGIFGFFLIHQTLLCWRNRQFTLERLFLRFTTVIRFRNFPWRHRWCHWCKIFVYWQKKLRLHPLQTRSLYVDENLPLSPFTSYYLPLRPSRKIPSSVTSVAGSGTSPALASPPAYPCRGSQN